MDPKRADLMPAAAVLVGFVLEHGGIGTITACTWALREGVLLDLARPGSRQPATAAEVRRRSVEALAGEVAEHGRQVARLALALFDALAGDLGLPAATRELLEYAALLHDVGHRIDRDRHHRHSAYLIRNAELLGFEPLEIETIAQVARGHRKQIPRPSDPELRALPARTRRHVRALAALLRVADALDRTHFGVVREVRATRQGGRLVLRVDPGRENAELELWAAERRVDLLSRLLGCPVRLRLERGQAAAQLARAGR
jgi:exopolyphosphatase/guanosine-5'-triphosphate,3'-diphosphate pyrophosphatase